ncbi:unnamed protein product [Allacma fusca]|uniref:G-protein coupled receptors family 1 profile domain-containing protein n=1 Tax=Allacma fusca TaxID=39272 RepID=A0A8J2KHD0_9HEXA|nr:unnamed protein product [Allacma fusca]
MNYAMNHSGFDYYDSDNSSDNGTDTIILEAPVGYSTLHIIIASIILTFMMIVVVIGNMLVIIAIATEKTLKNIQNWFIASLAVADFFVGLMIMPFSLANELMGYWIFGKIWCSIHSALDVLLCTSSIMNICLISLDRYWSITQAVDYLKKRTPARAAIMIAMVWILSALISIPPLLGWSDQKPNDNSKVPTCEVRIVHNTKPHTVWDTVAASRNGEIRGSTHSETRLL